jgi:hypothetical protein
MPKFEVILPCTMSVIMIVDAVDKEDAVDKALEEPLICKIDGDEGKSVSVWEFEAHREVVKGNVFYGVQNEPEVTLAEYD